MHCLYPANSAAHQPPWEIFDGQQTPHSEVPARFDQIFSALQRHRFELAPSQVEVPAELLAQVHRPAYLNFLSQVKFPDQNYHYPSVFQYRTGQFSTNGLAQRGYFCFDLYTPLANDTHQLALESASTAYAAAQLVQSGAQRQAYALCRPPGHHAEPDQMGGYCYLNNCAVAAEFLSQSGQVATLDVDFHHGNGTQHIFEQRPDVFTTSMHADPNWKFPFFSGFANEIGVGAGENYNLNRPLPAGITDRQYLAVLNQVLQRIAEFAPKYLVVSFGADIHADDPIGGFNLSTAGIHQIGRAIAALNLPTVIVQEGGYNTELLGENVVSFLAGFTT